MPRNYEILQRNPQGWGNTALRWTAQLADSDQLQSDGSNDGDAGLMQVGARYYDSQVGRFITRDTELDQLPYCYCGHDPVNNVDPTGHDPQSDIDQWFQKFGQKIGPGLGDGFGGFGPGFGGVSGGVNGLGNGFGGLGGSGSAKSPGVGSSNPGRGGQGSHGVQFPGLSPHPFDPNKYPLIPPGSSVTIGTGNGWGIVIGIINSGQNRGGYGGLSHSFN